MRRLAHSIVFLAFGLVAACGGGDGPTNTDSGTNPSQISSVTPNPMVEGQSAVLTGTNFSPVAASNTVTMDNVPLTVTQASATSLTVTIPPGCGPLRTTSLRVTAAGVVGTAFSAMVAPDPAGDATQSVQLAIGEQVIYRQPRHCFDLPTNSGTAQYLIGIQSAGRLGTVTRDVTIEGTITGTMLVSSVPAAAAQASPSTPGSFNPLPQSFGEGADARLLRGHRARHHALMDDLVRPVLNPAARLGGPSPVGAPARAVVDGTENVGDTVLLRLRKPGRQCGMADTDSVTAVLKAKSVRSMWWADVENPAGGFTNADLEAMGDLFDETIWAGTIAEFGHVNDIDGNGRVVILITKKINEVSDSTGTLLGFVNPCDLFPRDDVSLFASNEGEFFYSLAPDPMGLVTDTFSVSGLLNILPAIITHEFTHIIQFSRREAAGVDFMDSFLAEGQATLAEEVVGHLVLQNGPGQNLDAVVAFDFDSTQVYPWYFSQWIDLVYYFGWPGERDIPRLEGTPHGCTWIAAGIDHPCGGRPLWYGVTWSFLRWASDLYGAALGGGPAFQTALIDSNLTGMENLEQALASQGTLEDHLARWAAMLYMDDRPGASAENSMSSWDLVSITAAIVETAWLHPPERGFINFTETVTVRDPSTAYFLVGAAGASSSYRLRIATPTGANLDSAVQVWLVRTQ